MTHTIQNQYLRATIDEMGAELVSLQRLSDGHEYLWHGDARWWHGHCPILFPATGGLWNGTYRHNGVSHTMPKHGFVRQMPWQVEKNEGHSLTLRCESTHETWKFFPWPFVLHATFTLVGRQLAFTLTVVNGGDSPMYFQAGFHPAFVLPDFDETETEADAYLRLQGDDSAVLRATEQGCTEPDHFPVPHTADGMVPVITGTFANEALIFAENRLKAATLCNKQKQPILTVTGQAPVWLFWSPQGVHTPFLCIEPWHGLCDPIGFEGPLTERPYINCAEPGTHWTQGFTIDIHE